MNEFEPVPILTVESPEQIKAFTDPLRLRVLQILRERPATNQQVADILGEPHAKVLYHIRFLLSAGLIRLVETQIKGGNVEKYYRAVAYAFDLRPPAGDVAADIALVEPIVDALRHGLIGSVVTYPDYVAHIHTRLAWLTPEQAAQFNERLLALLEEFWQQTGAPPAPEAVKTRFAVFIYRDPEEGTGKEAGSSPAKEETDDGPTQ